MSGNLVPIGDTGVTMLTRGAHIPSDITFDAAISAAYALVRIKSASRWAYIDLLMHSELIFGEAYAQMLDPRYSHPNSIANLRYTWRRFSTPESRQWDVSLSHYTAVCADYLTQDQRESILQEAEDNDLSRDEVRLLASTYGPHITKIPFQKEAFIKNIDALIEWARNNSVPKELIEIVETLFKEYRGEMDESFPQ